MEWPVGDLFEFCQYVLFQLDHLKASCLYVMMYVPSPILRSFRFIRFGCSGKGNMMF